jgi:Cu-Zn family superoxide dismutase
MKRSAAALLALTLAFAVSASAPHGRITLPAAIAWPEGIAFDPASHQLYVAGTTSGQIARIDARTGKAMLLGKGIASQIGESFPGVLGMKLDGKGRLWMAGGGTGRIFVADARTGRPIATIATQRDHPALLNDVAIVGDTAYVTDTFYPALWSVDLKGPIPVAATLWRHFAATPLRYAEGPNLNGIAATPDGRTLIVGQMNKGLLFRIDIATRAVTPIDLQGETVEGVDGLVLHGSTLFVVRQPFAEIVTIELAGDFASGIVTARTKAKGLLWPATAALDGDALLVVNSQFNKRGGNDPERPFSVQRVPLSALGVR